MPSRRLAFNLQGLYVLQLLVFLLLRLQNELLSFPENLDHNLGKPLPVPLRNLYRLLLVEFKSSRHIVNAVIPLIDILQVELVWIEPVTDDHFRHFRQHMDRQLRNLERVLPDLGSFLGALLFATIQMLLASLTITAFLRIFKLLPYLKQYGHNRLVQRSDRNHISRLTVIQEYPPRLQRLLHIMQFHLDQLVKVLVYYQLPDRAALVLLSDSAFLR